ncbi:ribosomal L1 domain-containing protein 1-like [Planococcus citri]|uniref:ribosomal L1 domain-containing protein 1-like n=1 Tax=Planococcus citri TaxID=170843 RepID=UPI0031FA3A50
MSESVLQVEKVKEGVGALLDILNKQDEAKSKNILDDTTPVFLQIDFVKIPKIQRRIVRIPLEHSLLTDTSDVCLIVSDLIRGRNVNHEVTVNHYDKLLKKKGITDVQKIDVIPSRRIRVDFDQYEAKRKLCDMYDFFLIDEKISAYLRTKLGPSFTKSRKWPVPIRIKRKNLKDEILSKLKKTSLCLDGSGTTKTLQIARKDMTPEEITDNILSVSKYISDTFPSGWKNIRSLHIKGPKSLALPIFMSCILPNDVPTPTIKTKRTKRSKKRASGELATLGKKVVVYPGGRVKVIQPENDSEPDEDENSGEPTD